MWGDREREREIERHTKSLKPILKAAIPKRD